MTTQPSRPVRPPLARRLFAVPNPGLRQHLACYGPVGAPDRATLVTNLGVAGLTGRGGAGFPTARKIASLRGGRVVVVGNGAEGEPLSSKDAALVARAPHLVLDGLQVAAAAVEADQTFLYLPQHTVHHASRALEERAAAGLDQLPVTVVEAPDTFVAGEESAVARRIEGGPALPRDRMVPTSVSGVRGRPTLVDNVETLAHVALIARFGPDWFRSIGDPAEPGSMLVTLSGNTTGRSVVEIPTGTPLHDVLTRGAVGDLRGVGAVLIGGYHGSWIPAAAVASARLSRAGLAAFGATPGAGIVHVIARDECGLARTADIVGYLADHAAQQCGPCRNGLPMLAQLFDDLAYGRVGDALLEEVRRIIGLVDGRGACRHPDGTSRLARSALTTFADDVRAHRAGRCDAVLARPGRAGLSNGRPSGVRS